MVEIVNDRAVYKVSITFNLIFWSRKVLEGVQSRVELPRKSKFGPLFFFSKFMIMCQKASLVYIQIVRKGKFGPDSEKKLAQTCLY